MLAKNPEAYVEEFMLGQIYQMKGDNDAAVQAYESVLKKQPKFLPAANNLAYLLAETSTDEATLNRALELAKLAAEKENPEALDTLGWLYHLLGNREQSIETLNKAYEKIPDNKTVAYIWPWSWPSGPTMWRPAVWSKPLSRTTRTSPNAPSWRSSWNHSRKSRPSDAPTLVAGASVFFSDLSISADAKKFSTG